MVSLVSDLVCRFMAKMFWVVVVQFKVSSIWLWCLLSMAILILVPVARPNATSNLLTSGIDHYCIEGPPSKKLKHNEPTVAIRPTYHRTPSSLGPLAKRQQFSKWNPGSISSPTTNSNEHLSSVGLITIDSIPQGSQALTISSEDAMSSGNIGMSARVEEPMVLSLSSDEGTIATKWNPDRDATSAARGANDGLDPMSVIVIDDTESEASCPMAPAFTDQAEAGHRIAAPPSHSPFDSYVTNDDEDEIDLDEVDVVDTVMTLDIPSSFPVAEEVTIQRTAKPSRSLSPTPPPLIRRRRTPDNREAAMIHGEVTGGAAVPALVLSRVEIVPEINIAGDLSNILPESFAPKGDDDSPNLKPSTSESFNLSDVRSKRQTEQIGDNMNQGSFQVTASDLREDLNSQPRAEAPFTDPLPHEPVDVPNATEPTQWTCTACTYIHTGAEALTHSSSCAICYISRKPWTCDKCTFMQEAAATCIMCNTPRFIAPVAGMAANRST